MASESRKRSAEEVDAGEREKIDGDRLDSLRERTKVLFVNSCIIQASKAA